MELYFETYFMRYGLLLGIVAIWVIIGILYFKLRVVSKSEKIDMKKGVARDKKGFLFILIIIIIVIYSSFLGILHSIEYYGNFVVVEECYVEDLSPNSGALDMLYVQGEKQDKLKIRLGKDKRIIFREFYLGHLCEIEYWKLSKKVRRIKVIE